MAGKKKKKKVEEEIKEKVDELEELEVEGEEVEGGIFDEDLESEEVEAVSDFDSGDAMDTMLTLTTAPAIESWAGKDLEEEVRRGHSEWDWKPEEEFVGGDIYNPSSGGGDIYGAGSGDVYSVGGDRDDVYSAGGDGAYQAGQKEGKYDMGNVRDKDGGVKTFDQIRDERRGGRSMLEITGLRDDSKKKDRGSLDVDQKYQGKMAA